MSLSVATLRHRITCEEYEALVVPPPPLPTQSELLEIQIALWTSGGFATEADLRSLAQFVPDSGIFSIVPDFKEPNELDRMMPMVVLNNKMGINYINAETIRNDIAVPKGPYIILGVSDGRDYLNVAPMRSCRTIRRDGGSPFIGMESIAFAAAFPVVLTHHGLWSAGSWCSRQLLPLLYIRGDTPSLYDGFVDMSDPKWGSPWCRERKGLRP